MPTSFVRVRFACRVLLFASAASLPLALNAQAARGGAPADGTWGAEASAGVGEGGSLIRFFSPQWALLAGLNVSSRTNGSFGNEESTTFTSLRVGARRYARTGLGVRPIVGFGLTLADGPGSFGGVGGYGELGAVYFFNPHVSLGGSGEVSIARQDGGGTSFNIGFARLTGAVYF